MSRKEVITYRDDFIGTRALAAVNPFVVIDVSSAGAPTTLGVDEENSGAVAITLAADSEAESVRATHGDIKSFDIGKIQTVRYICKVAGLDSVTTIVFGLCGDHNATLDSIAQNVWFRMEGSASTTLVVCETDDGTNDNNDISTSETLAATYKTFEISFTNGTNDVRFYMDNGTGQIRRVASSTTFDMSSYTGNLQPIFGVDKASGTGVPALTVDLIEIVYNR